MTATIFDVSRKAGVSISTVSRVLNRPYLVNEKTRQTVECAIKELGYRPNVFAQGLMQSRSDLRSFGGSGARQS
jgi:LacI family transcriptional regulator